MYIHSKVLAELLKLSPDEKEELANWLMDEATKEEEKPDTLRNE